MKVILILLLNLFFCYSCINNKNDKKLKTIKSYNLDDTKWSKWNKIEKNWRKNIYGKILKKYGLKMSCLKCEYIYFDFIFTISKNGKLTEAKKIKENICSQKKTDGIEADFIKYFKNLQFPKELQNLKIEVKLGDGLKC